MQITTAQAQYLQWLKQYDPAIYEVFKTQLKMSGALGQTSPEGPSNQSQNWFTKLADNLASGIRTITKTVEKSLPTYQAFKLSEQEIKHQTERVKQGLPPQPLAPPTGNPPPQTPQQQQNIERVAAITYDLKPGWQKSLAASAPLLIGGLVVWSLTSKK